MARATGVDWLRRPSNCTVPCCNETITECRVMMKSFVA